MYHLTDILEEINNLKYMLNSCNTTRENIYTEIEKIYIQRKLNLKLEIYEIMNNVKHYYVV